MGKDDGLHLIEAVGVVDRAADGAPLVPGQNAPVGVAAAHNRKIREPLGLGGVIEGELHVVFLGGKPADQIGRAHV